MSLADQLWCPTSVQVTVLQARGLKIKGKGGTNDAFAVMQVGKEKYQTTVAEKSVAPVWKEEATFDLPQQLPGGGGGTERSTLHVHVLHRALVGPDKLLGQAVINLPQLSQDKTRSKTEWFKLLDKTGKADKDRGEVLLDVQFLRNNMTASMFDLSAAGKSKSRLGKLKDKVRGKKKVSDAASTAAPSFPQVLTDSEDEEGNGDCQVAAGKDEKKKKKIKALFSHKSNLQRNMSQSMSVLPAKNSLSGSQSSGLNVDPSEGKKKFKFMIHKRSGSSGTKDSSCAQQKAAEHSSLCINGSHVYCDEQQNRPSRVGSSFSLASSGHGSMEDVPGSSPPSLDSLRATRQYSPWTEEEEEVAESVKEGQEEETGEKEQQAIVEGEEGKRREEERRRMDEENARRKVEEEEEKRRDEKQRRHNEEKARMEEERIRVEEERRKEEKIRLDNEQRRLEEEKARMEEEEKRREEERKQREEEEERKEMERIEEKRREEMARKEEMRKEMERRRMEEEERERKEEEMRKELERRRVEEEERARKEEEMRKELERRRVEEERERKEEERRKLEEKQRIEEERFKKEMMDKEEQEKMMQTEEQRRQQERDKKEKTTSDEEEFVRMIKEMKKREEETRTQERMKEEDERTRKEEDEEKREDVRLLAVNTEEVEKKSKSLPSEEQMKSATEIKTASLNPFDESFEPPGSRSSKASVSSDPHRSQLLRTRTSSSDDKDHGGSQREKRPAPQPPGSTDIRTVPPQSSFQALSPVSRSDPQKPSMQTGSSTAAVSQAVYGKGPAPARPTSNISQAQSSEVKQEPITCGYNPFEDDEGDELTAQDEANSGSKQWAPGAASQAKVKSWKKAHAPPLPELSDTSSTSVSLSPGGDAGPAVTEPHGAHLREAKPATPQPSGGKKDEPPTTNRRLLPVKPLNSLRQSVNQGEKDIKTIGILSDEPKNTKGDPELKGPYSQLTKAELISLVLKQKNQILEKDTKISELEQYIDNLLVRVMEDQPSILMSMNSLKKSV